MNDDANFRYGSSARVIADSISPKGDRVTTIEATMHRFVLAEFNTHRVFSRNSASSRAIPFRKQVERVTSNPAIPVEWASEQRGMQGGDSLDPDDAQYAQYLWLRASHSAIDNAKALAELGVHKSIVNRILEPFMWHTVIATATEWDGFWSQRCSELAQPEIKVVAEQMQRAYNDSKPQRVEVGEWHLPYINSQDWDAAIDLQSNYNPQRDDFNRVITDIVKKVSVARSARVSYLNHDGTRDLEKDLDLYNRLTSARPLHASPLEHVCTPFVQRRDGIGHVGNLRGWSQFRHDVERTLNGH